MGSRSFLILALASCSIVGTGARAMESSPTRATTPAPRSHSEIQQEALRIEQQALACASALGDNAQALPLAWGPESDWSRFREQVDAHARCLALVETSLGDLTRAHLDAVLAVETRDQVLDLTTSPEISRLMESMASAHGALSAERAVNVTAVRSLAVHAIGEHDIVDGWADLDAVRRESRELAVEVSSPNASVRQPRQ